MRVNFEFVFKDNKFLDKSLNNNFIGLKRIINVKFILQLNNCTKIFKIYKNIEPNKKEEMDKTLFFIKRLKNFTPEMFSWQQ